MDHQDDPASDNQAAAERSPTGPVPAERRRHARERRPRTPGWVLLKDQAHKIELFDLSSSGAGIRTTMPFAVGAILSIRIGLGPLRLPRMAKVTRCNPDASGGYVVGIAFVGDLAGMIGGAFGRAG